MTVARGKSIVLHPKSEYRSCMKSEILEMAKKLPLNSRVELLDDIWSTILQEGNTQDEIPEAHWRIVEVSLEDELKNPDDGVSIEEFEIELDKRFGKVE